MSQPKHAFDSDKRFTWGTLEELALTNPIVNAYVSAVRRGHVTQEQATTELAVRLALVNAHLVDQLGQALRMQPPPVFIVRGDDASS